jgi:hypothetical protein
VDILDTLLISSAFCRIEKMACPCGLTQEKLLAAPNLSLGPGMVCIAFGPDGNPCGRRLVDHPGKNHVLFSVIFLLTSLKFSSNAGSR